MNCQNTPHVSLSHIAPVHIPSTVQKSQPYHYALPRSKTLNSALFYGTPDVYKSTDFQSDVVWLKMLESDKTLNKNVYDLLEWHSLKSHCPEEKVAAIILGYAHGRFYLLSVGVNGSPIDYLNPPLFLHKETCEHGEHVALRLLPRDSGLYHTICYTSLAPCEGCADELLRANVDAVVFSREYRERTGIESLLSRGKPVYKIKATGELIPLHQDLCWRGFGLVDIMVRGWT